MGARLIGVIIKIVVMINVSVCVEALEIDGCFYWSFGY